mgnify:CR=1 FL=1
MPTRSGSRAARISSSGSASALAPVGAWIAVTGRSRGSPILLGLAVLLWTAGFDILYALQDEEHDRKTGLQSLPRAVGTRTALAVSALLHAAMIPLLDRRRRLSGGGPVFTAGISRRPPPSSTSTRSSGPGDLSRINAAFFTANGFVSVTLAVCGIADVLLRTA